MLARAHRPVAAALALVAFCWLWLSPYSALLNNANERVRVLQVRALVAGQGWQVGAVSRDPGGRYITHDLYGNLYAGPFVNDLALVCAEPGASPPDCVGTLYPAKGPGMALLAAPALWLVDQAGWIEPGFAGEGRATRVVRLFSVTLPMLGALVAFAALALRSGVAPPLVARGVLATGLGTNLFPYAISYVSHALASGLLLVGLWSLQRAAETAREAGRGSPVPWAVAAGVAAGFAVMCEYHAVVAAGVLAVWAARIPARRRILVPFAAAAGACAVALGAIHGVTYGHPLQTGHFHLFTEHNRVSQADGFLGLSGLYLGSIRDHLFDLYMGAAPLMPWLVAGGVVGAWRALRGVPVLSTAASQRAALAIVGAYVLFCASLSQWRFMNGWSIGPRYLVPAVAAWAFLALHGWSALARRSAWLGRLMAGAASASVAAVAAVTTAFQVPPDTIYNPVGELALPLLRAGYGVDNLGLALGLGGASLWPVFAAYALACGWILFGRDGADSRPTLGASALGFVVAAATVAALASHHPTPPQQAVRARAFVKQIGEGVRPPPKAHSSPARQATPSSRTP